MRAMQDIFRESSAVKQRLLRASVKDENRARGPTMMSINDHAFEMAAASVSREKWGATSLTSASGTCSS